MTSVGNQATGFVFRFREYYEAGGKFVRVVAEAVRAVVAKTETPGASLPILPDRQSQGVMCISNNVPYVATVGLEVETHGRNLAGNAVRFALMG